MVHISRLPNELLSVVFRLATVDDESLQPTYEDPFVLSTYRFDEYGRSLEAFKMKASISAVSKHWNALSAPFLCEYIFCLQGTDTLDGLIKCLRREDAGIWGNRGQWTRRVDISCSERYEWTGEMLQWQLILPLIPKAIVVDVSGDASGLHGGWSPLIFILGPLENLRRVQWHAKMCDLSDLQQLSLLCPNLTHLTYSLDAMDHPDAATDAITISFPHLRVLVLEWDQTESHTIIYPSFNAWNLPELCHFGYFLRGFTPFRIVMPLLQGLGDHLKSLELPTLGKNTLIAFPGNLFSLLPALEILILDIFKVSLPATLSEPHKRLHTLGWRLRLGSSLYDMRCLHQCREYFNLKSFPCLKKIRVVHPTDFWDYSNNMTTMLIMSWSEMINDEKWVPIVDFHGEHLQFPSVDGIYEDFYEDLEESESE